MRGSCKPQAAGFKPQTADCRLLAADFSNAIRANCWGSRCSPPTYVTRYTLLTGEKVPGGAGGRYLVFDTTPSMLTQSLQKSWLVEGL